jgi:hypothetical protein
VLRRDISIRESTASHPLITFEIFERHNRRDAATVKSLSPLQAQWTLWKCESGGLAQDSERPSYINSLLLCVVPGGGVEPPRAEARRILSPLRLPVPPSRR